MNVFSVVKQKIKRSSAVAVPAFGVLLLSATSSFAAIDYTTVTSTIASAVTDVVAGGVVLLGGYVGYWGIKKVIALFAGG
ncbi:MAG: hypothetical protein D3906_00555 [Candidatus Electrothrix sp. AUS1_2]|nr:hypothetical protein [Candidatus Electrothrix sp. AUS1_2]